MLGHRGSWLRKLEKSDGRSSGRWGRASKDNGPGKLRCGARERDLKQAR